jgi:NADH:ubiquinone oxidoreductase subunit 2 (subunit N)
MVSSIITMLFASFATMYQKKIKRFLAYSSINHVGYMLMGLSTGTLVGLHSFFFLYFGIFSNVI